MTRLSLSLSCLVVGLVACASEPEPIAFCDLAADHIESCIPGYIATRPGTCSGLAAEESERMLDMTCPQILAATADGKADAVPAIRGIKIRRDKNRTYFMVPLAQTWGADQKALIEETLTKFRTEMKNLNAELCDRGIDFGTALEGKAADDFATHYANTIESLIGNDDIDKNLETKLGESYGAPRELSTWDRYVLPQAFVAYFSAKFSGSIVIGGGVTATVLVVVQPWLSIAVDHTLPEPIVVGKSHELDVAFMGIPGVEIGVGAGGGAPIEIGVGAVFGPLNRANDVAGWGIGASLFGAIPFIGGVSGKLLAIVRNPPLFLLLAGYASGTTAELNIRGSANKILDVEKFLEWVESIE